ncbi:hypothetical protein GLAREA_03502 [Glarea lozoyensis ATCC 20868]|uniref:2EXR domain-containing protein n=1 Tax=Glarea lozoyensis (strain ATCC 20868 / MF5171) TaxID=1116229 RepID=S3CY47_GLAL2|nr:uncharacterized protein GLAREA_03502 [Glarea lozoyensis ATCC 20868]EPE30535.1 hypothetical protein GLAREA_03502 [Glarea lozoyensis ATCC 20868]
MEIQEIYSHPYGDKIFEDQQAKFRFFPKLPIELRLIIWKIAVDEGRIIHLSKAPKGPSFVNLSGHPPLLEACLESRIVAKRFYVRGFEQKMYRNASMYFSPADTLYFETIQDFDGFVFRQTRFRNNIEKPLALNNCDIRSVTLGTFGTMDGLIERSFTAVGMSYFGHKTKAARDFAMLTNLERLTLLLDNNVLHTFGTRATFAGESIELNDIEQNSFSKNGPIQGRMFSYSKTIFSAFKSKFENTLRKMSHSYVSHINEGPGDCMYCLLRGGNDLPVSTSEWWKNPKVSILDKEIYTKGIVSKPGIFKRCERLERADQKALRRRKRMKELIQKRATLKRKNPYMEENWKTAIAKNEAEIEKISDEINLLRHGRE